LKKCILNILKYLIFLNNWKQRCDVSKSEAESSAQAKCQYNWSIFNALELNYLPSLVKSRHGCPTFHTTSPMFASQGVNLIHFQSMYRQKNYPSIIKHIPIHARRTMIATKPMTVTRIGTSSHTILAGGKQLQIVKVNWHSCRCSHMFDGRNDNRKGGRNREGVN